MASRADRGTFGRSDTSDDRSTFDRFVAPNANLFLRLARQAAQSGDIEHAFLGYRECLATWRRANDLTGGKWKQEEALAEREYSAFLFGR